jgi:hypothetical protein
MMYGQGVEGRRMKFEIYRHAHEEIERRKIPLNIVESLSTGGSHENYL